MRVHKAKRIARAPFTLLFGRVSSRVELLVGVVRECRMRGNPKAAAFFAHLLEKYGVFVSGKAEIGKGLKLPHPTAIVIGEGVVIGSGVTVYQSVTLGGRVIGDWQKGSYPHIGDDTVLFAGVVVVGKVKVGKNCIIGANSVVLGDIPDNSVAVGAPARVVRTLDDFKEKQLNGHSDD